MEAEARELNGPGAFRSWEPPPAAMEFVLLLVSSLLLTARAAAAAGNPVLDVDGDVLRRGHLYYAMSMRSPGGGLTLHAAPSAAPPCPLYVAQAPSSSGDYSGRPLAFFPENAADDVVREGNTLYVMFPEPTECPQSTVWRVDREAGVVTTGGTASAAVGPHYSRFAIRMAGDAWTSVGSRPVQYQIQACPCSAGAGRASCRMGCRGSLRLREREGAIGLEVNNSEDPHIVEFVKVKEEKAASS